MECPTKEQIKKAASTSSEANKALRKLFPEAFQASIRAGQIYEWGLDSDGACGLVIHTPRVTTQTYTFINFLDGSIYLTDIPCYATKQDLVSMLGRGLYLDKEIRGPKCFASWKTKNSF